MCKFNCFVFIAIQSNNESKPPMNPGSCVDMEGWPTVDIPRHGPTPVHPHVEFLIKKNNDEACPQRTPEWYEKRSNHLTASSIASAVGDNPYDTRMTAIRKKIGLGPAFRGNAATEHGNHYEDIAIGIYEQRTGEKQIEFGLLESIKHDHNGEKCDTSFLAGSPDGITASGRLLEVKCPFRRKPNGTVPKIYMYQIQGLMHMLDLPICDFIEYVPESTWSTEVFDIITVVRSDIWWCEVFPQMQRFWEEVIAFRNEIEDKGIEHVNEKTTEVKNKRGPRKKKEEPIVIELPENIPSPTPDEEESDDGTRRFHSLEDMQTMAENDCFVPWKMADFVQDIEKHQERVAQGIADHDEMRNMELAIDF